MTKPSPASLGFSLIELLITVAIMSVVVGGSIAAFITFQSRQEVLTATKNVQQLVKTAQGKARVQETPTDAACNTDNNRLQGYRVSISSSVVTIDALCGADNEIRTINLNVIPVQTENLSGVIYSGSSPTSIEFYTLYRGLDYTTGSKTVEFTNTAGLSYSFTVSSGGAISEVQ